MSRQTLEGQGHEKLVANRFGVATITRLLKEIYVATSTKSVATQIRNKPREKVTTEKREATTEEATKTEGYVMTELSMSQQRDQFRP